MTLSEFEGHFCYSKPL